MSAKDIEVVDLSDSQIDDFIAKVVREHGDAFARTIVNVVQTGHIVGAVHELLGNNGLTAMLTDVMAEMFSIHTEASGWNHEQVLAVASDLKQIIDEVTAGLDDDSAGSRSVH